MIGPLIFPLILAGVAFGLGWSFGAAMTRADLRMDRALLSVDRETMLDTLNRIIDHADAEDTGGAK